MHKDFDVDSFFIINAASMNYPPARPKKQLQESYNKRVWLMCRLCAKKWLSLRAFQSLTRLDACRLFQTRIARIKRKARKEQKFASFCIHQIRVEQKPFTTETRNFTLVFLSVFVSHMSRCAFGSGSKNVQPISDQYKIRVFRSFRGIRVKGFAI